VFRSVLDRLLLVEEEEEEEEEVRGV